MNCIIEESQAMWNIKMIMSCRVIGVFPPLKQHFILFNKEHKNEQREDTFLLSAPPLSLRDLQRIHHYIGWQGLQGFLQILS